MHRVAVGIFVLISALMIVFGITSLLFALGSSEYLPGLSPDAIQFITGQSREQLFSQEPTTIELLRASARVPSAAFLMWGIASLVVVLIPFRARSRWAWWLLWTFPLFFGGLVTHELSLGEAGFVFLPLLLLVASVTALLTSYSTTTRKH